MGIERAVVSGSRLSIGVGAVTGAYSHIALDSLMHEDVFPLSPFSERSPWLGLIPVADLEGGLLVAGVLGVIALLIRFRKVIWS